MDTLIEAIRHAGQTALLYRISGIESEIVVSSENQAFCSIC